MASDYPEVSLLVGGEQRTGGGRVTQPVVNPATEEVLGELPHATDKDLDDALERAEKGFHTWRAVAPMERNRIMKRAADILRERQEDIARVATMEEGKSLTETRIEVNMSADILEWYGEEGRRAYGRVLQPPASGMRMTVRKEPVGPVAALAPWNFPLGNPARKLGAALGAGCSCVLKPAEETPASALAIANALIEAGVPDGVISVVFGVPGEVAEKLITSPVIQKISFTGSIPIGKELMALAAKGAKRTTMELGGHAPVLVFDDVDVDSVLDQSVASKFRNAGQVCVSPTRFYVHDKIFDEFVDGFTKRAKQMKVGNGLEEGVQMGPLAHERRLEAMDRILEDVTQCGGTVHTGGEAMDGAGYFYAPTVISDLPNTARAMNEEPFGPIALINRFSDTEAVFAEANRLPYGLAAYGFSNSSKITTMMGDKLEAGMIGVNTYRISVPESPFGGVKESGHGSEEGMEGLEACLVTKFVSEA